MSADRYGVFFWGDENGLELDNDDACMHLNILNATDPYF